MTDDPGREENENQIPDSIISTQKDMTFVESIKSDIALKNRSIGALIRARILTGFFVIIPIFLSIWIAWFLFSMLTEWTVKIQIPHLNEYISSFWMEQIIRLFSLVLIVIVLFIIGQFAHLTFGRKIISLTQKLFLKLPIINFIYSTCKQIGDALWSSKGGNMFRQVVLFEYPLHGTYAIGFLTNENKTDFEVNKKLGKELVSVFMPTTPNPTSGFLMFIPHEKCIFLEMSVSDAMRLIVSCGAVIPENEIETIKPKEKK